MKSFVVVLLILILPLHAALPGLTHTASISSESTAGSGDHVFHVAYTITNNSAFDLTQADLDPSQAFVDSLNVPGDCELPDRFRYYGLPKTITGTGQTHTVICHPSDTNTVRDALNGNSFFDSPKHDFNLISYEPFDLTLGTITLDSEVTQPDGRIHLTFSIPALINTGSDPFQNVKIKTNIGAYDNFDVTVITALTTSFVAEFLSQNQTLPLTESLVLSVISSEKDAVIDLVTSQEIFTICADEIIEAAYVSMPLDPETLSAYSSTDPLDAGPSLVSFTIIFASETPFLSRLQIGHHLINSSETFLEALTTTDTEAQVIQYEFIVSDKQIVSGDVHLTGHLEAPTLSFGHIKLEHPEAYFAIEGDFRATDTVHITNPWSKPFETNFPPANQAGAEAYFSTTAGSDENEETVEESSMGAFLSSFNATPIVINEQEIVPGVFISGQAFFSAFDIDLEMTWKNATPTQLQTTFVSSVYLNLIVETRGGADNRNVPDIEKSLQIIDLDLPAIIIPLGQIYNLTINPNISFDAGVNVFLPGKSTIPINTGITIGGTITYGNGGISTTGIKEVLPPLISKTEMREALQSEVEAWLDGELGLNFAVSSLDGGLFPLISGGTAIGARIDTNFLLDPLGDPWWSLDGQLSATARANLSSFNVPLIDAEQPLGAPLPLFHLASTTPSPAGARSASENLNPDLGDDLRWATVLENNHSTPSGIPHVKALSNGHSLLLTLNESNINAGLLSRLDEKGNLLWTYGLSHLKPKTFTVLPDDSSLIASLHGINTVVLTKLDPEGLLEWETAHEYDTGTTTLLYLEDLATTVESGSTVYYLTGSEGLSNNPYLFKYDATGSPIFEKHYLNEKNTHFESLHIATNGDLLICGDTLENLPDSPFLTLNGLLTRIAPDGTPIWSRLIYSQSTNRHFDLTEDPVTGDIYTVGQHFGTTFSKNTGIQVAKWTADGDLHKRIILQPEIDVVQYDAYSYATSCFFAHGTLFLTGRADLGTDAMTWVSRLSSKLGCLFFTTIDGDYEDSIASIAPSEEGFLLAFHCASINPWGGNGSTNPALPGSGAHTMISLQPWEGLIRFHPLANIQTTFRKAYSFGTYDVANVKIPAPPYDPGSAIHATGLSQHLLQSPFQVGTEMHPGGPTENAQEVGAVEFTSITDFNRSPAPANVYATVTLLTVQTRDASDIPSDIIASYPEWEDWHALSPNESGTTADPDHDGIANILESFTGTNPLEKNQLPILTLEDNSLNIPVSPHAGFLNAEIQTSPDLQDPWTFFANPAPTTPTQIILSQTPITPDQPKLFYRLKVTQP